MAAMNGFSVNGAEPEGFDVPAVDESRPRLEADIAAAKTRTEAARQRAAELAAAVRAEMHAEVVASQQRLAHMEREHEQELATIKTDAKALAARIIAEARALVSEQRRAATDEVTDVE